VIKVFFCGLFPFGQAHPMYSNCGYKENTVSWNSGLSYHEEHEEHKDNIMNLYYFFFVAFVNFVVNMSPLPL